MFEIPPVLFASLSLRNTFCSCCKLAPLLDQALFVATRAERVLAREIAVARTDGERRRHGDVRKTESLERAPHQCLARIGRRHALVHVEVKDGAARVLALQFLLARERL